MSYDFLTPLTALITAAINKAKAYTDSSIAAIRSIGSSNIVTSVAVAAASGSVPGTATNSNLGVAIGGNGLMYSVQTTPEAANANVYDVIVLDDLGNTVYTAQTVSGAARDDMVFHYNCTGKLQVKINNYGTTPLVVDVVLLTAKMNVG